MRVVVDEGLWMYFVPREEEGGGRRGVKGGGVEGGGWWRDVCGTLLKAWGGRLAKEITDGWNSGMRSVEEI